MAYTGCEGKQEGERERRGRRKVKRQKKLGWTSGIRTKSTGEINKTIAAKTTFRRKHFTKRKISSCALATRMIASCSSVTFIQQG